MRWCSTLLDSDRHRTSHMIEAAEQAISFVEGRLRSDLDNDAQLRLALLRALEVLGEAASRTSPDLRASNPEIPWRRMVGTRNRLVHANFDVDLGIVRVTATKSLPALVPRLKAILEPRNRE